MSDLIDRQAAIGIIQSLYPGIPRVPWLRKYWQERYEPYINTEKTIRTLPSAQPEIIYCGECKHMMPDGKCRQFADSTIRPSASDFCSAGERKDNG